MPFQLPELPYAYDALEPYCDEATVRLHHDVHHRAYVDGLNKTEEKLAENRDKGDFTIIKHWEHELAFHGSGHLLHTLFWQNMRPGGGGNAQGSLAECITKDFGSFDNFKKQFTAAALAVEGSGWAILVWSPNFAELEILQVENHQNHTQWGVTPLLTVDVWEHAYYLKYQNKRSNWVEAWWNLVNWEDVLNRFEVSTKLLDQ
ncbi:superoxide dismutase [Desulfosporosinus fructosivorans]|uniref:Superoxide dismutase n=1 Tax=Desulfosporosinus fructosivorans TaxID=2018669 RepID=A0A4Z0R1Q9_9FIRM|nr:superoxide dismutase [Desulfosporosinus fructosivorans]TGE35556.1 superoxide dismutase [Desulfosporosinus fructosivorans]